MTFSAGLIARFWAKVDKAGPVPAHRPELGPCWLWTGNRATRPDGTLSYGRAASGKRGVSILAHRFAYLAEHPDEDPPAVCHRCDNVACVRPAHLEAGTQDDNLKDMRDKGRAHFNTFPEGTAHPNAKIDQAKADEVRRLHGTKMSLAKIGAVVGLHASTVHDIVRGKTWRAK